jgi:hypothetical protein
MTYSNLSIDLAEFFPDSSTYFEGLWIEYELGIGYGFLEWDAWTGVRVNPRWGGKRKGFLYA